MRGGGGGGGVRRLRRNTQTMTEVDVTAETGEENERRMVTARRMATRDDNGSGISSRGLQTTKANDKGKRRRQTTKAKHRRGDGRQG